MRIACLMMQKNERELIEPWIAYHADLFGIENLYVYDNGSEDPGVLHALSKWEIAGLKVFRQYNTKSDFESKGVIFSEKIKEMDRSDPHDFYLPLDCDEFVCVSREDAPISIDIKDIQNELAPFLKEEKVLRIRQGLDNSPNHPDYYMGVKQAKCFFANGACDYLDIGFHVGRSRRGAEYVFTNLAYITFHHKPYEAFKYYAAQKLIGRVKSLTEDGLRQHLVDKGPGFHLVTRMLMTKAEYDSNFSSNGRIYAPALLRRLRELGQDIKFYLGEGTYPHRGHGKLDRPAGYLDALLEEDDEIILRGWALTVSGEAASEFVVQIGSTTVEPKTISRMPRADVVKGRKDVEMECGFEIRIRDDSDDRPIGAIMVLAKDANGHFQPLNNPFKLRRGAVSAK